MPISLSGWQDLLGSNGSVLMRMVLVFYPVSSVPYIAQVILLFNFIAEKVNHLVLRPLQGWIVVVMSKIQKALLLFWQSTMRPLLDPIVEKMIDAWEDLMMCLLSKVRVVRDRIAGKMKTISEGLEMHLANDAEMGHPKAKLIGLSALLSATFFLQESKLRFKYDETGVMMVGLISICMSLLTFSDYWSKKLEMLHQTWGCTANLTSNFTSFILGIFLEKFYKNSLENLCAALCMAVFLLSLQVALRPWTDPGFFGLILGVVGSGTHNHFGFKYPTWIIGCLCLAMFGFKSWLDKQWSDFEEDLPRLSTYTDTIGRAIMISSLPLTFFFVTGRIFRPASGHVNPLLGTVCQWIYFFIHYYFVGSTSSWIERNTPNDLLPPTRVGLRTRFMNFVSCPIIIGNIYYIISLIYYDFGWILPSLVKWLLQHN